MARNKFDVDESLESPFDASHLKRVLHYIGRHKWKMLLALLLSSFASVAGLFSPKITEYVLNVIVPNKQADRLLPMAAAYLGIIGVSIVFTVIRSRMMAKVSQEIIYDIRRDLFAHLQRLPFSYYDSRPAGKILVRVINYVNSVSDILSNGIINSILEIINVIFIVVFMYATEPTLATVVVAGLPVFVAFIMFIKPRQRKAWQQQSNKNSNYNAYLAESIDGVRVSQLFARQEVNISIMKKLALACRKAWMRAIYISNSVWVTSQFITQIVYTVLYIAGVYWLGGGIIAFGTILAMGQYLNRFWQPITNLANIYNSFVNNLAYLERIFETMDEPVVVDDKPGASTLPTITGEVRNYIRDKGAIMRMSRDVRSQLYRMQQVQDRLTQQLMREPSLREVANEMHVTYDELLSWLDQRETADVSSLNETVSDDDERALEAMMGVTDDGYEQVEQREWMKWVFSQVTPDERRLLELRFVHRMGQRETARLMNVSQMQVSRMERRVLARLREHADDLRALQ